MKKGRASSSRPDPFRKRHLTASEDVKKKMQAKKTAKRKHII